MSDGTDIEGAADDGSADPDVPGGHQPWWRQAISIALTIIVLIAVFGFVLPQVADYRTVLESITNISAGWWVALIVVSAWFLIAYPIVLITTLRTLRLKEAFTNHSTGTAITNSLPGGGAIALGVNYAMYMSWGFTPEAVSAGLLSAGVWDWFGRIALPILAVAIIALGGDAPGWMWALSIGGTLWVAFSVWLIWALLRSDRAAKAIAGWFDRVAARVAAWFRRPAPGTYRAVLQFRTDLRSVVSTRAIPLTAATIGNHAAMATLYTVSIYAVGISTDDIPVPWVVLSFALGRFLVMIPVSPGGLGLVDLGWIGLLTLGWQTTNPGEPVDQDLIAAGVLLFRALSLFPPIPIGMGTWLFWRFNRSWRRDWRTTRRGESTAPS